MLAPATLPSVPSWRCGPGLLIGDPDLRKKEKGARLEVKRTLLAISLTFAVLLLWATVFPPPTVEPGTEPQKPAGEGAIPTMERPAQPRPEGPVPGEAALEGPGEGIDVDAGKPESVAADAELGFRISTPLFEAEVTNRGARIESWTLLSFAERVVPPGGQSPPLRVIQAEADQPLQPLAVFTGDVLLDERLASAFFRCDGASDRRLVGDETAYVACRWAMDGRGVEKRFTFRGDSYAVDVEIRTTGDWPKATYLALGPGWHKGVAVSPQTYVGRAVLMAGGKLQHVAAADVSERKLKAAGDGVWPPKDPTKTMAVLDAAGELRRFQGVLWAGVEETYFAELAIFAESRGDVLVFPSAPRDGQAMRMVTAIPLTLGSDRLRLYIGPKDPKHLAEVDPRLASAIDYGMFESLAKVMFSGLSFFHRYVGNWGVAIILLTLVIKILFLPLTIKQMAVAEKMAKLAPRLKELEAKYKRKQADPKTRLEATQQMQQERMKLFQQENVNPLGGCLPMLVYLPFLYGFYSLLSNAIELRHAPFLLWIQDLSAKDPYYVTPLLMMISMIVQQALTPMTGDPLQRRMMYMMPLVFGWVLKDLASGLVLFWLTQNVLSILQQVVTRRLQAKRTAQA